MNRPFRQGFSLVELVVVVACLAIVAGVVVPRVSVRMAEARDARRVVDLNALRRAIDQYHADKGVYPQPAKNPSYGGWDVSHDGDFIHDLVAAGYLKDDVADPINDATFHYRYYVYDRGAYGCSGEAPYYVLGVRNFETAEIAAQHDRAFGCATRDWGQEFAYVVGGGTAFR